MKLVIGNKNYSSWSLRPWLALTHIGATFEEDLIPLDQPDTAARIGAISPAGKVPILIDGTTTVWESLAILEYLNEKFPGTDLFPADPVARARARSISCEMISGFRALRGSCPMNLRREPHARALDEETRRDIARIGTIWSETREAYGDGGPFLFGAFSAADAMFAPVATRFRTYGIKTDPVSQAYVDALHEFDPFQRWKAAALEEKWIIPHDEVDG